MIERLGTWAARHRRLVIVGWVVALVAVAIGNHALGGVYSDTLTIPGSTAQHGLDQLKAHDKTAGGQSGQVVFVDKGGSVSSQSSAIDQSRSNLQKLPHVLAVSDPLSQGTVSKDGGTAYATVNFDTNPQSLGDSYISQVDEAVAPARKAGVHVSYGGQLGQAAAPKPNDVASELIGITVALIVLLAGFGSVIAGVLPLLSAIIGVFTGLGLLGMVAAAVSFGTSSPTLATMMGLGVGIDYALFLTTRHRQRLMDGEDPMAAIHSTLAGSGRSIVIAATTVVIAMCGLYASGITFIGKLGLAAAITVAVAALSALTLVPALLAVAGTRIDRWHVRTPVAEPNNPTGPLHRYTARLEAHPWRYALSGILVLLILAIPVLSIRVGHVGPGSEPTSYSERQAFDAIDRGFGPGANGPLTVVVTLPASATDQDRSSLEQSLPKTLAATPDVASVTPFQASSDGKLLIGKVVPKSGPESDDTASLVAQLQDDVLPGALHGQQATGYVTGTTAATIDFQNTVSSRLPIIIGVVLAGGLPAPAGGVPQPGARAQGGGAQPPVDRRRLRDHRRRLPMGLGREPAGHQRHRPHRVLRADDHLRHRFRPVNGLRGVPAVTHPRALARRARQHAQRRHRPQRDRPRHQLRGADHGQRVLRLPALHERGGEDAGAGPRRERDHRRDAHPPADRAVADVCVRSRQLVDPGVAGSRAPAARARAGRRPRLRGGDAPGRPASGCGRVIR